MMYKTKITPLRKKLIKIQHILRTAFDRLGIIINFDVNYHFSYGIGADNLDTRFNEISGKHDAEMLVQELKINKSDIILDLGCGTGRVERWLIPFCRNIIGIDISSKALKMGRNYCKNENIIFQKNNGYDINKIRSMSIDALFSFAFFIHLEKEITFRYLNEIWRVLKPNGRFLLEFGNLANDYSFSEFESNSRYLNLGTTRPKLYCFQELQIYFDNLQFYGNYEFIEIKEREGTIIIKGSKKDKD